MRVSAALLISGLAVQQVAATWNRNANHYKTPQYNNNECTDKQKGGYDWGDVPDGESPGTDYDGNFDFSGGWKCKSSFGKRDHLTKRTFGSKALTNKCGEKKPAKFSCKGKKDGFSATEFQVSTEYDTDVDFHYKMPDGSTCKQRSSCKKEGTTVKNTQCGGAESVEVYLPPGGGKGKGNNGEDKEDCEIGFHHIGFDCNPPVEYTPPPAYTPSPPPETSTPPPETTTPPPETSTPATCGTDYEGQPPCDSTSTPPPETTTPPPETTTESPPPPNTTCGTGEGQTPCDSTSTPPPETTTPPSCGNEGQPPCETATPPPSDCGNGYGQTPCETTPPPETTTPPAGCGNEGQPPCDSTTPPPETTTPAPSCGSEGYPACETATPPPETTTSPAGCGNEGQPPCETTTPPPETTTPPAGCGSEGQPPCETTTPPPSDCGNGYGQTPCETTTPPSETTTPPAGCGNEGQPPCETTTPPSETTTPPASCGNEGQPPCETTTPPPSDCGNGYGQTPCETTTPPPAETTPPTSSGTGYGPGASETPTTTEKSPEQPTPSPSGYTPPPGGYTPPEVLPSCLNTWLQMNTKCKDNTDSACYCKIPDFTDNVLACVAAHGTEQESAEAVQYFIGICAPAVPENPGIVTNCPSQIPINPTQPSAPATSAPATSAPGYGTDVPAAPTPAPGAPAPGAPAPYPVTTVVAGGSTYTVPQVGFTTEPPNAPGANPTEPVALYPGVTPAPVPATTTGAAPPYPTGPSGLTSVVVPTGSGAPNAPGAPEFTGAASPLNVQLKGAVFGGAVLAFFAL